MASQRLLLILLILFFVFITHDSNNQQSSSSAATHGTHQHSSEKEAEDRATLNALESLSYDSFDPEAGKWLNLTGFQSHGSFPWARFTEVKERAREDVNRVFEEAEKGLDGAGAGEEFGGNGEGASFLPLYRNISCVVVGGWTVVEGKTEGKLDAPQRKGDNITSWNGALLDRRYDRNITAPEGRVKLQLTEDERLVESKNGTVAEITANMLFQDHWHFGQEWEFRLRGIAFLDSGVVILSTTSEK